MNKPKYSRRRLKKMGILTINRGKTVEFRFEHIEHNFMDKVQYFLKSKKTITISVDVKCSVGSMVMMS